jgi:outer membrane protein OmpA-like peptidoglycan-associated protein
MRFNAMLLVFIASFFLFSCVPQKKVSSSKKELASINDNLYMNQNKLLELNSQRVQKENQNEIDDTANARIRKFIERTKNEIDTLIKNNSIRIGETVVEKTDWDRLRSALSVSRSSTKKINDKILFLNDLISRNLVVKLDQDVIFEPGKYQVSPAVAQTISKQFEPAVKEIDMFTRKYPDFPLSLVITAKGYADGTVIPPGTPLYNELKQKLTKLSSQEPDSKELNKQLSRERAESVKSLFQSFATKNNTNEIFQTKVLYLFEGKGETPPDPKVNDYKVNDPRRRIVLLFWSVFPE